MFISLITCSGYGTEGNALIEQVTNEKVKYLISSNQGELKFLRSILHGDDRSNKLPFPPKL